MSTSLFYRMQGVRVYRHQKFELLKGGNLRLHFSIPPERCSCPVCGHQHLWIKEWRERELTGLPFGRNKTTLVVKIPKLECLSCHTIRQAPLSFARPNKHYTHKFEEYVVWLLSMMTVIDVARTLDVSWDTVREIEQHYLGKHFSHPSLKGLRYIAIDEISSKKGFVFLTLVMNLETGAVIYVGDGRQEDALKPFWKRLRRAGSRILAVATDMSRPYTKAIRENLPNAVHVFDRFHIVKMFNEVIDNVRRYLYAKIQNKDERRTLKGMKYILLKRPENLDSSKGEPERLRQTLEANQELNTLYYLKEELYSLWDEEEKESAQGKMLDVISYMLSLNIPYLKRFAKSLRDHALGILAWFDYQITTGPLEGLNNKIKVIKRKAYGFRNMDYFKLKILSCHVRRP